MTGNLWNRKIEQPTLCSASVGGVEDFRCSFLDYSEFPSILAVLAEI